MKSQKWAVECRIRILHIQFYIETPYEECLCQRIQNKYNKNIFYAKIALEYVYLSLNYKFYIVLQLARQWRMLLIIEFFICEFNYIM